MKKIILMMLVAFASNIAFADYSTIKSGMMYEDFKDLPEYKTILKKYRAMSQEEIQQAFNDCHFIKGNMGNEKRNDPECSAVVKVIVDNALHKGHPNMPWVGY